MGTKWIIGRATSILQLLRCGMKENILCESACPEQQNKVDITTT